MLSSGEEGWEGGKLWVQGQLSESVVGLLRGVDDELRRMRKDRVDMAKREEEIKGRIEKYVSYLRKRKSTVSFDEISFYEFVERFIGECYSAMVMCTSREGRVERISRLEMEEYYPLTLSQVGEGVG